MVTNCEAVTVYPFTVATVHRSSTSRAATTPGWTAVEVARVLWRPRALATLDAALRRGARDRGQIRAAAPRQAGRRGIVNVCTLIPLAAPQSESPMESEARLVMIDGDLPVLQDGIVDRNRRTWRADIAWPDRRVAVEYDGYDWHSDTDKFRRDRQKRAALQEIGWVVRPSWPTTSDRTPWDMLRRIEVKLQRSSAA